MNRRFSVLLSIVLTTLSVSALAAPASPAGSAVTVPPQSLNRGQALTSNKEQYQVLPGARAVERLAQEQPQQALARVGGGNLIATKGNFVVFTTAQQNAPSVALLNGTTFYPVVFNQRTMGVGIMPGTLAVKLKNMASAAAVAADHGLDVVRIFDNLQTAFFRVRTGQDVVAAAAALAADVRVSSAELEVIENVAVPH